MRRPLCQLEDLVGTQRQEMIRDLRRTPVEVLRVQDPLVVRGRRRFRSLAGIRNRDALLLLIAPEASRVRADFLQVRPTPVHPMDTLRPDARASQAPSPFAPNAVRVAR
jgi:hypothetical protein